MKDIQTLNQLEYSFFLWLNHQNSPMIDTIMYWVSYRFTWIPLYLLLIFYIFWQDKKSFWRVLLFIIISVGLADRITSGLMKPYFQRLRPCHDPSIMQFVHLVGDCGGQYGFVSSHAANSFALATCFFLLYCKKHKYFFVLYFWATLVSYSRIYNGVHFVSDVLLGAMVGIALAIFFRKIIFKNKLWLKY